MTAYTLNLPKGVITYGHGAWRGSSTQGEWSPFNPIDAGGWKAGDTLTVTVAFNLKPSNLPQNEWPPASEYHGAAAIALYNPTTAQIQQAVRDLYNGPGWNIKGFVGAGISTSSAEPQPGSGVYFYDAQASTLSVGLTPASRGSLDNYIHQWTMKYYNDPTLTNPAEGTHIELVFGYGDPMVSEEDT